MSFIELAYGMRGLVALAVLLVYITGKVRTYYRLKAFRGPFASGVSNFWHARALLGLKSHLKYKEVIDKYGTIARIGPNDLITSSPELLTHMSAVRSPYTRGEWFHRATRVQHDRDHIFSEIDEEKHTKRRMQIGAGYSGKENLELEGSIDARIVEFVQLIKSKYLSTEAVSRPVDFARKIQFLTLDVISAVGFGEPFGDLRLDEDVFKFAESSEAGLMAITVSVALGLTKLLQVPFIARRFGPSEKDSVGLGRMMANARTIITRRLAQDTEKRSDMIASFVRHGLDDPEQLLLETCVQILAGSDTTAAALRGIMLYLMTHRRVYTKLQAEIDGAVASGLAPPPPDVISDSAARQLEYLQAVIKEGMRAYPPVTDAVPKVVPEGGETVVVDGETYFLPGGTHISYAALPLHHSKAIFGDDAAVFRPERWLTTDEEKLVAMNRTHELIFGYGRYQCLGKPIALMEISKTIFELIRHFDWCLSRPEAPWKEHNLTGIFSHTDMWVLVSEREDEK